MIHCFGETKEIDEQFSHKYLLIQSIKYLFLCPYRKRCYSTFDFFWEILYLWILLHVRVYFYFLENTCKIEYRKYIMLDTGHLQVELWACRTVEAIILDGLDV
jgi:hypothetical protein